MPAVPSITTLLVEPHKDSADLYSEYFRHHGVNVITTSTAVDALAAVLSVDVLVTNLRLPGGMDGVELITGVRRNERTKDMPIVVLSTDTVPSRQRAQDAGCDAFLVKPTLPHSLLHEVRRLALRSKVRDVRAASAKAGAMSKDVRNPKRA